jgi:transcriptional regulator with XRE-family HTH domain
VRQDKPPSANHHLIQARQRKCWSQETVAGKLGTTRVTISRWEQGLRFPSPHYRELLCALFESTPEALGLLPVHVLSPASTRDEIRAELHLLAQGSDTSTSPVRKLDNGNGSLQHIQRALAPGSIAKYSAHIAATNPADEATASTLSRDLFVLEEFRKALDASAHIVELCAKSIELFGGDTMGPRLTMVAWRARLQPANGVVQEFVMVRLPAGTYHPVRGGGSADLRATLGVFPNAALST